MTWFKGLAADFYDSGIQKLVPRLNKCLDNAGAYNNIIIMFIDCKWVDTRWQWSFNILHIIIFINCNWVVTRWQ